MTETRNDCLALDANDSLVVAGSRWLSTSATDVAIARYLANGSSDPTFGTGGVRVTSLAPQWPQSRATGIAIDQFGRYLLSVTAETANYSAGVFAAMRLTPVGGLDASFGDGGVALVSVDARDHAIAVAIDPISGSAVVGGATRGASIATARTVALRLIQ